MRAEEWLDDDEDGFAEEADEVDEVLGALRTLIIRSSVPVVRACLEEARDDIAHLTGRDAVTDDFEGRANAA